MPVAFRCAVQCFEQEMKLYAGPMALLELLPRSARARIVSADIAPFSAAAARTGRAANHSRWRDVANGAAADLNRRLSPDLRSLLRRLLRPDVERCLLAG